MIKKLKTEGFVLKKKNLPSQDILITFFTQEYGKITALAKGAKKITSRRLPTLQTGNLLTMVAGKRDEFYFLEESHLVSAFSAIKKSHEKVSIMYFVLFVLDRLLPTAELEHTVYLDTKKLIFNLARSSKFEISHLEAYLNTVLTTLGFISGPKSLPELKTTIEELTEEKLPFYII